MFLLLVTASREPATRKTCSCLQSGSTVKNVQGIILVFRLAREGNLPHFAKLQVTNGSGDVFCLQSSFDVPATASFTRAVYNQFLNASNDYKTTFIVKFWCAVLGIFYFKHIYFGYIYITMTFHEPSRKLKFVYFHAPVRRKLESVVSLTF